MIFTRLPDRQVAAGCPFTSGRQDPHRVKGGKRSQLENVSRQVDRASKAKKYANEDLSMRQRRINEVKHWVSEAWAGRYDEGKAIRKAAFLYNRLWNTPPWDTRNAILEKTFDVEQEIVVDDLREQEPKREQDVC